MPIDTDTLAIQVAYFIDELPTEATFRGKEITIRSGEAPKTRELLVAGFTSGLTIEYLMKLEDCDGVEPADGETLTIASKGYKIVTVTPLLSLTSPAGYRLTLTKVT